MNRAELERLHERWKNYPGRYTPTALDMTELLGALLADEPVPALVWNCCGRPAIGASCPHCHPLANWSA